MNFRKMTTIDFCMWIKSTKKDPNHLGIICDFIDSVEFDVIPKKFQIITYSYIGTLI